MPPSTFTKNANTTLAATQQWFEQVVLGLNLCPFAHRPARLQQIHFAVCDSAHETKVMDALIAEIQALDNIPSEVRETTLLITPNILDDFYDYQFFLEEANRKIKFHQWQGVFQLASFHPHYCFAGATSDDSSNLTNRSPYPIIHILREQSLTQVLKNIDDAEEIPQANIEKMKRLSPQALKKLFPYLTEITS